MSFVCKFLMPQYEALVKSRKENAAYGRRPQWAGVVLLYLRSQCRDQPLTWRRKAWLPPSALGQEGTCGQDFLEAVCPAPRQKAERARCPLWAQGEKRAGRPSFGG